MKSKTGIGQLDPSTVYDESVSMKTAKGSRSAILRMRIEKDH